MPSSKVGARAAPSQLGKRALLETAAAERHLGRQTATSLLSVITHSTK